MNTMADTEPNWEWYRSFVAVLDTGSLSAAGRAMGLTQPTVGRHIDSLETALSLKLFTRSFDGFAPTDAALELKPYAAGSGVRGTVRLTASEVVGVEVLPPILAALREAHPALVIELVLSNKVDDLLRRDADIAVRTVRPAQDALIARRVGGIELGLYAHKRYLAAHGTPKTIADLQRHAVIGYDTETAWIRQIQQQTGSFARASLALRTDSDVAQLAAIRAGFGIGGCQARLAARDPALVRVLKSAFSLTMDTWIAMHEDLRDSARCAVTFAALATGLSAYIQATRPASSS
jgi:DNA-binding transcriptional LysR family regulator